MGLERITLVMEDVGNIFEISIIKDIISEIENISGVKYNESAKSDISIRVIADHIRAVTFMVSDGVVPSNEGRGYVLRRLLRRAARHGKLLGIQGNFLKDLSLIVMNSYFSDRKSTRLNSSHVQISYAVFCLKKKIPLLNAADWFR